MVTLCRVKGSRGLPPDFWTSIDPADDQRNGVIPRPTVNGRTIQFFLVNAGKDVLKLLF